MLNSLSQNTRALAAYMSTLSEEAYCAGWMEGLEYVLWDAVCGALTKYGRLDITPEIIQKLNDLSKTCKGWIYFDEHTEETYIPEPEWLIKFQEYKERSNLK